MFIWREVGGTGTGCLFQFQKITKAHAYIRNSLIAMEAYSTMLYAFIVIRLFLIYACAFLQFSLTTHIILNKVKYFKNIFKYQSVIPNEDLSSLQITTLNYCIKCAISPLIQMWMKTHRYMVCMKYP